MTSESPIGIFDSGFGGLSVAREVRARLPAEHLIYLADSAYVPYGPRPLGEVQERSLAIGRWLVARGVKVIVVACNTATAAAVELLRATLAVPVVGTEPAVKPAIAASRARRVAVLATAATLKTERYRKLVQRYTGEVEVTGYPPPGLVELVERGETSLEQARATLEPVLAPIRDAGADVLVLGSTHFPFLRVAIGAVLGSGVQLLDSGAAVARQTARILSEHGTLRRTGFGSIGFWTTGDPAMVGPVASRLWGEPLHPLRAEV